MLRYIAQYTRTWDLCMQTKTRHQLPLGELVPSTTPTEPWQSVSVDFITHLPEAHGYDAIMVVVDMLSKRSHFLQTHDTVTAEGTARIYFWEVWKHHGMPNTVQSD